MAEFADIVEAIASLRETSPRVVVAISGFGGAGKSTLTKALVAAVPDSVRLRGDDFLHPVRSHRRSTDWDGVERVRMRDEVLEPFRRGDPVSFRPYDWDAGELGPRTSLPPASVLLVDAIGVLHPDLAGCFDLTIWVDVDLATAGERGRERDRQNGHDHDRLWAEVWTPNDRDFAATFDPASTADLKFTAGGPPGDWVSPCP
jgi:uridine kinase